MGVKQVIINIVLYKTLMRSRGCSLSTIYIMSIHLSENRMIYIIINKIQQIIVLTVLSNNNNRTLKRQWDV